MMGNTDAQARSKSRRAAYGKKTDVEAPATRATVKKTTRENAAKHLFRHLRDEQMLLQNPLVGPALLSGSISTQEIRDRVAQAATMIRNEDQSAGRAERGERQSACLLRCDLGSEDVASLASEYGISPRQLARERRAAWLRSLQYIVAKKEHLTVTSVCDLVQNRALALFRAGRPRDGADMVRKYLNSSPSEAVFGLCSLALMQHNFRRTHEANETYAQLNAHLLSNGSEDSPYHRNLAVRLLKALLSEARPTQVWLKQIRELSRGASSEAPIATFISRTTLRLFLSLARTSIYQQETPYFLALSAVIEELVPSCNYLDCYDLLSLHFLRTRCEWQENGFNEAMEGHVLRALHLSVSYGWTGPVAESASMLANVYYLNGNIPQAKEYRDIALAAGSLSEESGPMSVVYNNLASAALDTGCLSAAALFNSRRLAVMPEHHFWLDAMHLVNAEILIRQGAIKQGTAESREVLCRSKSAGNLQLVATASRIFAMGLDADGQPSAAMAAIKESMDLARAGYCEKYDAQRIDDSYKLLATSESQASGPVVTHEQFVG